MMKRCLFAAVMSMLAVAGTTRADLSVDTRTTDFSSWIGYGDAVVNPHLIQLTATGSGGSAGAAFAPAPIVINFNQAFTFDFNFYIQASSVDPTRGDGLTFTLSDAPGVGGGGSDLGYAGLSSGSVAFAVDTFDFGDPDPVSPSIQILQGGAAEPPVAFTETGLGDGLYDTTWLWHGTLAFTPSGLDDEHGTLTGTLQRPDFGPLTVIALDVDMSVVGDVVLDGNDDYLGREVYYGFTAGNGLANDGQFIVPEPAGIALLGLGSLALIRRRRAA